MTENCHALQRKLYAINTLRYVVQETLSSFLSSDSDCDDQTVNPMTAFAAGGNMFNYRETFLLRQNVALNFHLIIQAAARPTFFNLNREVSPIHLYYGTSSFDLQVTTLQRVASPTE